MAEESKGPLVNIGDLTGLKEPIVKLIETISGACGRLVNTLWLDRKDADNAAYRTMEAGRAETTVLIERAQAVAALASGGQQLDKLEITSGNVQAQLTPLAPEVLTLLERTNTRVAFQQLVRQRNLDAVNYYAAEALAEETEVSKEPVSLTFSNRFFRSAEDVSESSVQALWGRILAGEVKRPGSFSPRTLEFLTTLTQEEAQDFERLCAHLWTGPDGDYVAIVFFKRRPSPEELPLQFSFECLTHLDSIGLIEFQSPGGAFASGGFSIDANETRLAYNGSVITVCEESGRSDVIVQTGKVLLTKMGKELASICKPNYKQEIMDGVMREWLSSNYSVFSDYSPLKS